MNSTLSPGIHALAGYFGPGGLFFHCLLCDASGHPCRANFTTASSALNHQKEHLLQCRICQLRQSFAHFEHPCYLQCFTAIPHCPVCCLDAIHAWASSLPPESPLWQRVPSSSTSSEIASEESTHAISEVRVTKVLRSHLSASAYQRAGIVIAKMIIRTTDVRRRCMGFDYTAIAAVRELQGRARPSRLEWRVAE